MPKHKMMQMATWKQPKIEKKTNGKRKLKENATPETWKEEMGDKYLTTWTSPGAKTRKN